MDKNIDPRHHKLINQDARFAPAIRVAFKDVFSGTASENVKDLRTDVINDHTVTKY